MPNTLNKQQRLCGELKVANLFRQGANIIAYPLRICYLYTTGEPAAVMMVSVPKKLIHRANKRNLLKRRIREAYRTHQDLLPDTATDDKGQLQLAFIYISNEVATYRQIEKAIIKGIGKIR